MALDSNVRILDGWDHGMNLGSVGCASATVIGKGDLLEVESGVATVIDGASDVATFGGVSMEASETGDTKDICILHKAKVNITVDSGTYYYGYALKYSSGANGTDWSLANATAGEDAIMFCVSKGGTTITNVDAYFDAFYGVVTAGGGLFESPQNAA